MEIPQKEYEAAFPEQVEFQAWVASLEQDYAKWVKQNKERVNIELEKFPC